MGLRFARAVGEIGYGGISADGQSVKTQALSEQVAGISGIRGRITPNAAIAPFTWFRVGGPAEVLFQPVDADDLALFLEKLSPEIPVSVIGVGSNLLVRDG